MDNGSSIYLNDVSLPFCDRLNIKPYPDLVISSLPATSSSEPNSTESTSLWSSCGTMVTLTKLIAHPSWATERAVFQGGSVRRVNLVGWSRKLLLFHYCSSCYCLRARDIVSVHCSPASCIMQILKSARFQYVNPRLPDSLTYLQGFPFANYRLQNFCSTKLCIFNWRWF